MRATTLVILLLLLNNIGIGQLHEFEWADEWGNPPNSTDAKTRLASCTDGSFYLSGEFVDSAYFIDKPLVSAGGTDVFVVKCAENGTPQWSVRIGGNDDDYIQDIDCDTYGNLLVTGYFYGTTQIGNDQYSSYGSQDIYVAKLSADGDFLWSFRVGGPMADYLSGLSLSPDLDFFLTGHFYGEIMLGDTTLYATQGSDIFLARYNTEGEILWTKAGGGSSSDQVGASACDPQGNLLVMGSFYYDITLDDTTLTTVNPVGIFMAKYFPGGQLSHVFQLDGTYLTTDVRLIAAASGDFYISGNFSEQVYFGDQVFDAGEFNQDIYLAKYDEECNLEWARHAHSIASDQVVALEADAASNVYIAGHYLDSIHFEQLTLNYNLCCGSRQIFIVYYNADGTVMWGDTISGARASLQSIELKNQDELLLSGLFSEEIRMGSLSLSHYDGFKNYITSLLTDNFTSVKNPSKDQAEPVIYPNPANHRLYVDMKQNTGSYSVFSLQGQFIQCGTVNSAGWIDISRLTPGYYFIRLNSDVLNSSRIYPFIKN